MGALSMSTLSFPVGSIAWIFFPLSIAVLLFFIVRMRRENQLQQNTLNQLAEKQIHKSETKFRYLLDSTPDPLIICDQSGKIILANQRCESIFGYQADELVGQVVEILTPETQRNEHVKLRDSYNQNPTLRPLGNGHQLIARHKSGQSIPVDISLSPLKTEDELFVSATIRDVSEQKRYEKELKRLANFPRLSPMPIIELQCSELHRDEQCDTKVSYINPQAEFLFPDLAAKGVNHEVLVDLTPLVQTAKQTGKAQTRIVELGDLIFEQQISYVADVDVVHITLWDVTTMRQLTEELSYQATHDSLTGLINRVEFDRRIRNALHEVTVEEKQHAFCYLDLDRFKIVNDQCGHAAGDALLNQLTKIIKSKIRDSDTLARLGGDEFGLLLVGCEMGRALQILEIILENINKYRFIWERKSFSVGASAGLVMLTKQSGNLSHVMQAADSACYVAKNNGGDRVHVYTPNDEALAQHSKTIEWAHRIQTALEKDLFILYSQSIHSLHDPNDIFHEVLLRMRDEDGNIVSPASFIRAAERYHLIQNVDRWVIQHVFKAIESGWLTKGICTVNLSGDSIGDPSMLRFVIDMLAEYRVEPESICFEITETAVVRNLVQTKRFISTLKGLGCIFALDDFGSGVSSFAYLQSLAVDILKIDGKLVRGITISDVNEVMVSSINTIGHAMQMKTVAEFVESEEILNKLTAIGIDYGQGYYFSKPEPISVEKQANEKQVG